MLSVLFLACSLQVPFGEAVATKEWLNIRGNVYKPEVEHPKKPVNGLACNRNEVGFDFK